MFYLSVCEECWRGGSAVTGVMFHQGRGGVGRPASCRWSDVSVCWCRELCWPRPRAPPPSSCCISTLDNFPPSAGIFWSHVIPLQRAAAGTHIAASVLRRATANRLQMEICFMWPQIQWSRHAPDCNISMWCRLHCSCRAPLHTASSAQIRRCEDRFVLYISRFNLKISTLLFSWLM